MSKSRKMMWATVKLWIFSVLGALVTIQGACADSAGGWSNENTLHIAMSEKTPYRVFTLSNPMRLIVDLKNNNGAVTDANIFSDTPTVTDARAGLFRPGWSRLVMDLVKPIGIVSSEFDAVSDGYELVLKFSSVSPPVFIERSGVPEDLGWDIIRQSPAPRRTDGSLLIAIDPGHGGIDPGAIRGDVTEKSIALSFATILADLIAKDPDVSAFLTRKSDTFVSLDDRVGLARAADADVFLSIHANTVEYGNAEGAKLFTLSDTASDAAAAALADYENRADLAAGLETAVYDNDVAQMLVGMARVETNARSRRLADVMVDMLSDRIPVIKSKPHRSAGLRVLRAPDIPSVLLELGFLSNPRDRSRLTSQEWQQTAAIAVLDGIKSWARGDPTLSNLVLK